VHTGSKVLVKVDDTILLIVGDPLEILDLATWASHNTLVNIIITFVDCIKYILFNISSLFCQKKAEKLLKVLKFLNQQIPTYLSLRHI
jgi:hypothetical protein